MPTSPAKSKFESEPCPYKEKLEFKKNSGHKRYISISLCLRGKSRLLSFIYSQQNNMFCLSVITWYGINEMINTMT